MPDPAPQTWEAAAAVLDASPICHLAFTEDGQPRVLPALHARVGTTLYLHGAPHSTLIRVAASGAPLAINAVVLDGVAVAHSACHSALNYRSVLCAATGREVRDPAEVERALRAITDRVTPGAWGRGRPPRPDEIADTAVVALEVTSFSLRTRSGPAREDEADHSLPGWSGVVPLHLQAGLAISDAAVPPGLPSPPVFPAAVAPSDRPGPWTP